MHFFVTSVVIFLEISKLEYDLVVISFLSLDNLIFVTFLRLLDIVSLSILLIDFSKSLFVLLYLMF